MNHPASSEPPERGNFAISILRVILWLLPAAVLFAGILLAFNMDEKWPILFIPGIAIFAGLGYFDRRL